MQILYSSKAIEPVYEAYLAELECEKQLNQQDQKFNSLMIDGISRDARVRCVTSLVKQPVTYKAYRKRFWKKIEHENGKSRYVYLPSTTLPVLRNICHFLFTFLFVLMWSYDNKKERKCVICDTMCVSSFVAILAACKLTSCSVLAIVTDIFLPPSTAEKQTMGKMVQIAYWLFRKTHVVSCNFADKYVFLSEKMTDYINVKRNKPYVVIEGLVCASEEILPAECSQQNGSKVAIYAGGLYQKYGVTKLVEAFHKIEDSRLELWLFGKGDSVEKIVEMAKKDSRIRYFGVVDNKEVLRAQSNATILVNPRPSSEEFALYSFPSKNMEYMASGVAVLTTKLPSMPMEYFNYVYLFDDETVEGMATRIRKVMGLPADALSEKGRRARAFVNRNKNNVVQAKKIIDLL